MKDVYYVFPLTARKCWNFYKTFFSNFKLQNFKRTWTTVSLRTYG